jgi:hypothetical protein
MMVPKGSPRGGLLSHPNAIRSVPKYVSHILALWLRYGKSQSPDPSGVNITDGDRDYIRRKSQGPYLRRNV